MNTTLTVTDNDGFTDTETKIINVKANTPPAVSLSCQNNGPQRVDCYSTTTDPDINDNIIEYRWDFGDGESETNLFNGVTHFYASSSTYTITLTAKDQYGGEGSAQVTVTTLENQAPTATISCGVSAGDTYTCFANASDPDGLVVGQTWSIEGNILSGQSIMYNFTNGGVYPVNYTVTDNLGKSFATSINIIIDRPRAAFTCIETETLNIHCKIDDSVDLENIVLTRFIFDDEKFSLEKETDFEFRDFGLHKIKLELTRNDGVISVLEKDMQFNKIYLAPKPKFSTVVDTNYSVLFNASESLYQSRKVVSYNWNFGDGVMSTTSDWLANHNYSSPGTYNVSLTVIDDQGNAFTRSEQVVVYNAEVEDPGDSNNDLLSGIDSDQDGIRDDIQRWINFEAANNTQIQNALKNLAKNWQELILTVEDREHSQELFLLNQKHAIYLYGIIDNDSKAESIVKIMKFLYFRTEERYEVWLKIQSNNAGATIVALPITKEERLNILSGN